MTQIPDGKGENSFAFSGEAKNRKYAMEIVHECNEAWKRLVAGGLKSDISLCVLLHYTTLAETDRVLRSTNVAVEGSAGFVATSDAAYKALPADSRAAPAPIDPSSTSSYPPSVTESKLIKS